LMLCKEKKSVEGPLIGTVSGYLNFHRQNVALGGDGPERGEGAGAVNRVVASGQHSLTPTRCDFGK
jgi:hypothetical protein